LEVYNAATPALEKVDQSTCSCRVNRQFSANGLQIVIHTIAAIAAGIRSDPEKHGLGRAVKLDDRTNIQNGGDGLRLAHVPWQAVQHNQRTLVRAAMCQETPQDPLCNWKILVFQQGAGLQHTAQELDVLARDNSVRLALSNDLPQAFTKIEMQAPSPADAATLQQPAERRLAGAGGSEQQ
jgi:hypothetical protein